MEAAQPQGARSMVLACQAQELRGSGAPHHALETRQSQRELAHLPGQGHWAASPKRNWSRSSLEGGRPGGRAAWGSPTGQRGSLMELKSGKLEWEQDTPPAYQTPEEGQLGGEWSHSGTRALCWSKTLSLEERGAPQPTAGCWRQGPLRGSRAPCQASLGRRCSGGSRVCQASLGRGDSEGSRAPCRPSWSYRWELILQLELSLFIITWRAV